MKRGMSLPAIILLVLGIIALILGIFSYFYFFKSGDSLPVNFENVENPIEGLSDEEAAALFDESFVKYLLLNIKAYNLHNPPFSDDTPKIELLVGGEIYNVEVLDTEFKVGKGIIEGRDISIRTSSIEAVKMMRNSDYITSSFNNGDSEIELIAEKSKLFVKGYMKIYEELSGDDSGITGDVFRLW